MAESTVESRPISSWFAIIHPRYRRHLALLGLLSVVAGVLVFGDSLTLQCFSASFAPKVAAEAAPSSRWTHWLVPIIGWLSTRPPLLVLLVFVCVRIVRIFADVVQRVISGTLSNLGRSDLEREVLSHLLRKDDLFFASRPPGEILNRLAGDVSRVVERRSTYSQRTQSAFLILGNLVFFIWADWRLAAAGVITCAAGAWFMHRMTRPVKEMDKAFLLRDDRVKSQFEEMLRAAPEVQVANLMSKVRNRFDGVQEGRTKVLMRYVQLNAMLGAVGSGSYLVSLVSLCVVAIYFLSARSPDASVALIPVIIKALPELFNNASSLVTQGLSLQLAETSCKRLLEYEVPLEDARESKVGTAGMVDVIVDDATYQYPTAAGGLQGGVVGVTTTFGSGRWTALVGGAGSGKSTLLQLLLGRTKPTRGRVLFGRHPVEDMTPAERSQFVTLMPQTVTPLDTTIRENLLFGMSGPMDSVLSAEQRSIVERSGLEDVCRVKALEMLPGERPADADLRKAIVDLRKRIRARMDAVGIPVMELGAAAPDSRQWVLEWILAGRCDREAVLMLLHGPRARRTLRRLSRTPEGLALALRGREVLEATRSLLGLAAYPLYSRLATVPIEEPTWQLRTRLFGRIEEAPEAPRGSVDLVVVALTSALCESTTPAPESLRTAALASALRDLVGASCPPFDAAAVHPFLTWRENLLCGTVDAPNQRFNAKIEQLLLEEMRAGGFTGALTEIGLDYQVGRGGTRLSGGQRQLVALCRALFRGTPIMVLDEPTSALDPVSRSRVAALLREWKKDRVLITVSHDPEFVREADELRVMESGRLAHSGSVSEMLGVAEIFRGGEKRVGT